MHNGLEVIKVTSKEVKCEGEAQTTGHPLIYLNMGEQTEVTCPYCGRHFVYSAS